MSEWIWGWEGKKKVVLRLIFSYLVMWNREDVFIEIMENWRRSKLGWGRREGKDDEFNFGFEFEVIIEEIYEWVCRVVVGYMVFLGERSI